MTILEWVVLSLLFFITSVVGVVTGSNSLITVPVMFQFGIDPKVAVATNMFGLTFMSIGGTLPFLKARTVSFKRLPVLIVLTLVGSALGAALVFLMASRMMSTLVSISMLGVAMFSLIRRDAGTVSTQEKALEPPTRRMEITALFMTFILGIYGGLFSGGYVTMLTAIYITLLHMTIVEAISITKIINIFSSFIATAIFIFQGLVDYRLGIVLSIVMFAGAYLGAHIALKINATALRRIFLSVVILLALKILLYDLLWKGTM
jgi:uncharacterized protein